MTTQAVSKIIDPTPGPYRCERLSDGCDDRINIVTMSGETTLATILFWDDRDEKSTRIVANALLLSAAPELRDLLKRLLNLIAALPTQVLPVEIYEAELEAEQLFASIEARLR